jgi:hypothetical protein
MVRYGQVAYLVGKSLYFIYEFCPHCHLLPLLYLVFSLIADFFFGLKNNIQ